MLKKFTDLSQLTKAVLKKADDVRAAVPHPQKPAPAPAPEAPTAETALSREDADCLAYFSHTSIADSRFATAGRVRTPVAPKRDPESRAENRERADADVEDAVRLPLAVQCRGGYGEPLPLIAVRTVTRSFQPGA